jgi:hypothetical protein
MSSKTYLFDTSMSDLLDMEPCNISDQELNQLVKEYPKTPWSKLCSEEMRNGKAKWMTDIFYKEYNGREFQSKHFKKMWSDPEHKKKHIEAMIEERNSIEGKKRMQEAARKNWDSRSDEERQIFQSKMNEINKNDDKRKDASKKIKKKWQDPIFKEKMKNRKPRGSDGSALKKLWDDPVWRAKTLESRRKKYEERIRSKMNAEANKN